MNRGLFILGLLLVSTGALATAQSFPDLFTPADSDLSIWYLGNIFGSDLLGGLVNSSVPISGIRLLSVLFGIFNQIALVVGIIVIVYTVIAGTLNTAHEGTPLGEKMHSLWLPMRVSAGIALLVPKGGTGYCLAQSLVMWLAVQGIGAADQVWNSMVDYFAQGGAIYSNKTGQDIAYMTKQNIEYTTFLQGRTTPPPLNGGPSVSTPTAALLDGMICIALFNNDPNALTLNNGKKYEVFTDAKKPDTLFFGNRAAEASGIGGAECGAVVVALPDNHCDTEGKSCATPDSRKQIYTIANWNMATALQNMAQQFATTPLDESNWDQFYADVYHNSDLYINYLVGYEDLLFNKHAKGRQPSDAFKIYKKYGWILAGNYYTVLSALKAEADDMNRNFRPPQSIVWANGTNPRPSPQDLQKETPTSQAYQQATEFWQTLYAETESPADFIGNYIPTYGQKVKKTDSGAKKEQIGIVNMQEIYNALSPYGKVTSGHGCIGTNANPGGNGMQSTTCGLKTKHTKTRGSGVASIGTASLVTRSQVENYIRYLTGDQGALGAPGDLRVAHDPILIASEYGKSLTSGAVAIFVIIGAMMMAFSALGICSSVLPTQTFFSSMNTMFGAPLIALAMFMYAQGAILGVFIPLIPYLTFFIGVVGWLIQVVEAVSAAPLVAIGLVFPETKDDIWGKAQPAYMMILALFLRPPLMLVGFAAAMIVLWVLTQLLNIGFLTLTAVTFRIEDMFGFVTIMMAYTTVFVVVVTRSYELINVVPNKVLSWIGDNSMQLESATTAIGEAKGGVTGGAGAVSGGFGEGQKAGMGTAEILGKAAKEAKEKSGGSISG
jgi:conjugal transfer/type IV secretion protein DotA/TraY